MSEDSSHPARGRAPGVRHLWTTRSQRAHAAGAVRRPAHPGVAARNPGWMAEGARQPRATPRASSCRLVERRACEQQPPIDRVIADVQDQEPVALLVRRGDLAVRRSDLEWLDGVRDLHGKAPQIDSTRRGGRRGWEGSGSPAEQPASNPTTIASATVMGAADRGGHPRNAPCVTVKGQCPPGAWPCTGCPPSVDGRARGWAGRAHVRATDRRAGPGRDWALANHVSTAG